MVEKKAKQKEAVKEKPKKTVKKAAKKVVKKPTKKAEAKASAPVEIKVKKEEKAITEQPETKSAPIFSHEGSSSAKVSDDNTKGAVKKPNFLQSVGRRKTSVARVKVFKNGSGKVTVNGKDVKEYFGTDLLVDVALGALINVSQLQKLDVSAKVHGGGLRGQAEAIRLGTSKALLELNPVFKKNLRKAGYLTRDPRRKERKKPGLKKARRAPQWSKR